MDQSLENKLLKRTSGKRTRPGLPDLKSTNICQFVENTVLSQDNLIGPSNFEQYSALLGTRNLIAACICYITTFQPPEKHKWEYVHAMLASGVDETYQTPAGTALDVVFRNAAQEYPDCLAWTLYQSAAEGRPGHFADVLSKALLLTTEYVFFS